MASKIKSLTPCRQGEADIPMQPVRAVLWDADGVLQDTPAGTWDLAISVVSQIPAAITGAAIDEDRIRAVAADMGLGGHVDEVLSVWWTFDVLQPTLEIVASVRAAGVSCYLATNQDSYRAACMRDRAPYDEILDGAYYSCDIRSAKPSAQFFEHIAADLGLAPEQLLFIDDQLANVLGARSAGLNAEGWTHGDGIESLLKLIDAYGIHLA
ncbi:HAD-IA family hydrolase [Terrabacter sp. NPDC080008]|uniref:HAD-IA family hydrolase n=1 Tax=Terrabacter sp. NPDC080008 TaxID=3155176 RepID=UPI00344E9847